MEDDRLSRQLRTTAAWNADHARCDVRDAKDGVGASPRSILSAGPGYSDTLSRPTFSKVTLLKSSGAIRATDEKIDVSIGTGTWNPSLPIPLSQTRVTPLLRLSYNTGADNGIFGICRPLDLPAKRHRTDRYLPRCGAGAHVTLRRTTFGVDFVASLYRLRIDGLFARSDRRHGLVFGVSADDMVIPDAARSPIISFLSLAATRLDMAAQALHRHFIARKNTTPIAAPGLPALDSCHASSTIEV